MRQGKWPPHLVGCLLTAIIWERKIRVFDSLWVTSAKCEMVSGVSLTCWSPQPMTLTQFPRGDDVAYGILEGDYGSLPAKSQPYHTAINMRRELYINDESDDTDDESLGPLLEEEEVLDEYEVESIV